MNIGDFILSGSPGSAKKKSTPQTSGPPVCCLPGPCAGLLCLQGTGEETPMVRPFMEILLFTLLKFLFMSRSLCFRWFWIVPAGFVEIIPSCMNLTWRTRQPTLESRWQWRRQNTHTCPSGFLNFFFFFFTKSMTCIHVWSDAGDHAVLRPVLHLYSVWTLGPWMWVDARSDTHSLRSTGSGTNPLLQTHLFPST